MPGAEGKSSVPPRPAFREELLCSRLRLKTENQEIEKRVQDLEWWCDNLYKRGCSDHPTCDTLMAISLSSLSSKFLSLDFVISVIPGNLTCTFHPFAAIK